MRGPNILKPIDIRLSNISTNVALAHTNGVLTDQQLEKMDDKELRRIGYGPNAVKAEKYMDKYANTVWGVHRAVLLLQRRKVEAGEAYQERQAIDGEALATL